MDKLTQTTDTLCKISGSISYIDIGSLIINILILIVLYQTAKFIKEQLKNQDAMLRVELLKDRITMGWSTDEPITEGHINNVEFLPDIFIPERYKKLAMNLNNSSNEKKKDDAAKIGKYLYLAKVYDYFLYVYTSSLELKDPLGTDWQNKWLVGLVPDDVFKEIRKFNKKTHPDFEKFLKEKENSV